jgi:hypothetical protein
MVSEATAQHERSPRPQLGDAPPADRAPRPHRPFVRRAARWNGLAGNGRWNGSRDNDDTDGTNRVTGGCSLNNQFLNVQARHAREPRSPSNAGSPGDRPGGDPGRL